MTFDGKTTDLLAGGSSSGGGFQASIDNSLDELVLPSYMAAAYRNAVAGRAGPLIDGSAFLSNFTPPQTLVAAQSYTVLLNHGDQPPTNLSLTITLASGLKVTVPPRLLSRPRLTLSQPSTQHVSTVLGYEVSATNAVLGAVFLSQAYLLVDYEAMKFSLASLGAAADDRTDPKPLGCTSTDPASTSSQPAGSDAAPPPLASKRNLKQILAVVLGTLLGVIAAAVLALVLIWRYKRTHKEHQGQQPVVAEEKYRGGGGYRRHRSRGPVAGPSASTDAFAESRPSWIVADADDAESGRGAVRGGRAAGGGGGTIGEKAASPSPAFSTPPPPAFGTPSPANTLPPPSRSDWGGGTHTPARNSYFTEELDISFGRAL